MSTIIEFIIALFHGIKDRFTEDEEDFQEIDEFDTHIIRYNKDSEELGQSIIEDIDEYLEENPKYISKVKAYENRHYKDVTDTNNYTLSGEDLEIFDQKKDEPMGKFKFSSIFKLSKAEKSKTDNESYNHFAELENKVRSITSKMANFSVLEYDITLNYGAKDQNAAYLKSRSGIHKRQLLMNIEEDYDVLIRRGAMNFTAGDIESESAYSFFEFVIKSIQGKIFKEQMIYTHYFGKGQLIIEPTERHIILLNVEDFEGGLVIERGMFLASDSEVEMHWRRNKLITGTLGGEGYYNQLLTGRGVVALTSYAPMAQLIMMEVRDDELRLDGHFAVAWSGSLKFKVEFAQKGDIIGSKINGEDLVDVFKGRGKVLISPVATSPFGTRKQQKVKMLDNEKDD